MSDYVIADVFTETALEGNPVAVFLKADGISAALMQRIAREMNLSETTFVLPPTSDGDVRVRIFTPVNELPFAGHPTLGTAIVLGASSTDDGIRLETAMGTIPFTFQRGEGGAITSARMRQPVPTWEPYAQADELLAALGLEDSVLPVEVYRNGPRHVYVGLESVAALSRVRPDLRALAEHLDMAANCFAGEGAHWRMRMFSPAYGVAEDAATGSAAGPLAIHLGRHGLAPFGQEIEILQGVEMGRPSRMYARVTGSAERIDGVEVGGSAVVVARGSLRL
ncbi:PhzF family phenazine biosynthesis protein [Streptomyces sp. N2-109]|uniref:PhzF family phenazine biosynthesis protein n=1 Tax=Streptomyces gossypii TaxID=2883101 RepID=A0ABT2JPS0_9ACTN|nr:PhzF family phenazine biosynthesis protein [Streptomyces gossypii]MCT2589751.1 PhzF family phenazine biosynthesis protein [Streptomyces gossypii]